MNGVMQSDINYTVLSDSLQCRPLGGTETPCGELQDYYNVRTPDIASRPVPAPEAGVLRMRPSVIWFALCLAS